MSKLVFASVISEIQQSNVFMTVKARICEAPEANLNGARVTEAFIDDIVGNESKYVGLPLYADTKALTNGYYNRLGHLYDVKTGEFHSTQIGSFYKFEKQVVGEKCYLVAYARIPKRNRKLSKAISELFAEGNLKFSFELSVGEYDSLEDDTILIDASENNYLEGTAIVSYPACEDAVALELVAQQIADEARKGESEMAEVETKAEVVETEAKQPEVAETTQAEQAETIATDESAAVYVTENHVEVHESSAYDTETGKSVNQRVTVETSTSDAIEGTLVETVDGVHVAEEVTAETPDGEGNGESGQTDTQETGNESGNSGEQTGGETGGTQETQEETPAETDPKPEEVDQDSYDPRKKKVAEEFEAQIAELTKLVASLKSEIAEMKEQNAQKAVVGEAQVNPFMGEINAKTGYSLLEPDKPKQYTLV